MTFQNETKQKAQMKLGPWEKATSCTNWKCFREHHCYKHCLADPTNT